MAVNESAPARGSTGARHKSNGSAAASKQAVFCPPKYITAALVASTPLRRTGRRPRRGNDVPATILDRYYPLVNPMQSLEEWQRFKHADLPDMNEAELHRELSYRDV